MIEFIGYFIPVRARIDPQLIVLISTFADKMDKTPNHPVDSKGFSNRRWQALQTMPHRFAIVWGLVSDKKLLNVYTNIGVSMKVDLSDLLPSIKKVEFQKRLRNLLNENVEGLSWDEKLALVNAELSKLDTERNSEPENKGKPWSDHELRLVLSMSPTRDSVMLLAKALKRGHGSIEQIYRWAGQSLDRIASERADHTFVQQIVKIRKELGWKSVGGNKS